MLSQFVFIKLYLLFHVRFLFSVSFPSDCLTDVPSRICMFVHVCICLSACVYMFVHVYTCSFMCIHVCFCPQAPKTPLQKSMNTLGKQLSFYSLCIIGRLWEGQGEGNFHSLVGGAFSLCGVIVQVVSCYWAGFKERRFWRCSPLV